MLIDGIEINTTPWEPIGAFLEEIQDSAEFKDFSLEAKAAHISEVSDTLILQLVKTKLIEAETHVDFIRFQAIVVSVMQIRNAILGKLRSRKLEENGNGR